MTCGRADPAIFRDGPVFEAARINVQDDVFRFARLQGDAVEGGECACRELDAGWLLCWGIEIDLRDFVAGDRAGIGDVDRNVAPAVGCGNNFQIRIIERGIGKAESEREERLDFLFIEPAITDVKPFRVCGFAIDARGRTLRISGIGGGIIFKTLGPSERKPSRGIYLAEKNVGGGPTAFIAWPPHLQNGPNFVEPGKCDGLADVENDDGVAIDSSDFFNEFVLLAGKSEIWLAASPNKNDDGVSRFRGIDCVLVFAAALLWSDPV